MQRGKSNGPRRYFPLFCLKGKADAGGFTLLEMLIALVVLSIGILGYTAVQYQSIGGRIFSRTMNAAITSGVSHMDELESTDFNTLTGSGVQYRFKRSGETATESDYETGNAYKIEWQVEDWGAATDNPNTFLSDLKSVKTTIRWKEKGIESSAVLYTFERRGKTGDIS